MAPKIERPHVFTHLSYQQGSTVSDYESLIPRDQSPLGNKRSCWTQTKWNLLIGLLLLSVTAMYVIERHWRSHVVKGQQLVPTLFQLKDADTHEYVNALHNPVYQRLQNAPVRDTLQDSKGISRHDIQVDKHFLESHEPLTVSWKDFRGVLSPESDLLALYCDGTLVEAATIRQIDRHRRSRWSISSVPRIMYQQCQFRILQPDVWGNNYRVVAQSPLLQVTKTDLPHSIHIAQTQTPASLVFQFITTQSGVPLVIIQDNMASYKFQGTSTTYSYADMCGAPANTTAPGQFSPPGQLHTVTVTNLEPNTTYQYKVGISFGQGTTWSAEYSTKTPPPVGDPQQRLVYLFYGDQGVNPELAQSWNKAILDNKDAVAIHHVGDLSYARGAAHVWQEWMDQIAPYTHRFPLMIAVGNHEYDHLSGGHGKDPSGVTTPAGYAPEWGNFGEDSGGECGVPTAKRFLMPQSSDDANGVFWYSYDTGNVHTTVISSEHDLAKGSPQHTWLEYDLGQVNRSVTPWLVVETHRPLYESQKVWAQNAVGIGMRYEVEDLLVNYKVDLVLGGHYHAYHRTCDGLYRSRCNNGGPMHITVGTAGAVFEESESYNNEWTAFFRKSTYGYGRLTVHNASVMEFEFVSVDPKNVSNTVAEDRVFMKRKH